MKTLPAALAATTLLRSPLLAETGPLETGEVTLGFMRVTDMAPLAVAMKGGLFADEGLIVILEKQDHLAWPPRRHDRSSPRRRADAVRPAARRRRGLHRRCRNRRPLRHEPEWQRHHRVECPLGADALADSPRRERPPGPPDRRRGAAGRDQECPRRGRGLHHEHGIAHVAPYLRAALLACGRRDQPGLLCAGRRPRHRQRRPPRRRDPAQDARNDGGGPDRRLCRGPALEQRGAEEGVGVPVIADEHASGNRPAAVEILAQSEYLNADPCAIEMSLLGQFEYELGDVREAPDFVMFFRDHASYPFYSGVIWTLTQMRRWARSAKRSLTNGITRRPRAYRPDLYMDAAWTLIADDIAFESDFPHTDGYRPAHSAGDTIDGIPFDARRPNEYIDSFPLGLETGQQVIGNGIQG